MGLNWLDVTDVSFNALLLLEQVQLRWLPHWRWPSEADLALALSANPAVVWTLRHKCPEIAPWLDRVLAQAAPASPQRIREAEVAVLACLEDLLVYALDPAIYDAQPFLGWDSRELLDVTDYRAKTVIDVGAGTGRLTFTVAPLAAWVFAVEPVANLRRYIERQAAARGLNNVYTADGLITAIPFPDRFADVTMGGHVFGDDPEAECRELARVTRPGGTILLCPGNNDKDNEIHAVLLAHGYQWSRFEEPGDSVKRKYWKHLPRWEGAAVAQPPQPVRVLKLQGAAMDIDLTTAPDSIPWPQDRCPWNAAEGGDAHHCAVKSVSICPYFAGVEALDRVLCRYPHSAEEMGV